MTQSVEQDDRLCGHLDRSPVSRDLGGLGFSGSSFGVLKCARVVHVETLAAYSFQTQG
jgi:hypothetical protein